METTRIASRVEPFVAECNGAIIIIIESEGACTLAEAREIRDALNALDLGE